MMIGNGWYVVGFGPFGELRSVRLLTPESLHQPLAVVVAVWAMTNTEAAAKARPIASDYLRMPLREHSRMVRDEIRHAFVAMCGEAQDMRVREEVREQ